MTQNIVSRIVDFIPEYDLHSLSFSPNTVYGHSVRQLKCLRASLQTFGLIQPVIENIETGHILNGTQLVKVYSYMNIGSIPVLRVSVSEDEENELFMHIKAIEKHSYIDKKAFEKRLEQPVSHRWQLRLRQLMSEENLIPRNGNKIWSEVEMKNAPLHKQKFAEYQVQHLHKEVWKLGSTEIIGTYQECKIVVEAWEKATGKVAEKMEIS